MTIPICDNCGLSYKLAGGDENGIIYGPSCECCPEDFLKGSKDWYHEPIEPYYPELESDDYTYDFDEKDPDWIASYEQYSEKLNEEAVYQYFLNLKVKYNLDSNNAVDNLPLYKILILLDERSFISDYDLNWLKSKNLFILTAHCYLQNFILNRSGWNYVKACRFYRRASYPQVTINLTNNFELPDKDIMSALYTTRGGAFRDIFKFPKAIECANASLNITPNSFYPYNLLGATYFQLYDWAKGHEYFKKARELGSKPSRQRSLVESELNKMDENRRREAVRFLLQKDPTFYSFARRFLC